MKPRKWTTINRKRAAYRAKMRPLFLIALEKQIKPLYDLIKNTQDINSIEVPDLDNSQILKAYQRLYRVVAVESAMTDMRLVKSNNGIALLKDEDQIMRDLILADIDSYLATEVGLTITAIGNTSKVLLQNMLNKLVPEIIEQGIGTGAAQTMLRDQIKSAWHSARYYRTERIVRTEVGRAANYGSIKGVRSTGVAQNKHWVSSYSATSRPDHMTDQMVDIDESFDIGGESLDFPGDPSGSAANTINCTCAVTYSNKGI